MKKFSDFIAEASTNYILPKGITFSEKSMTVRDTKNNSQALNITAFKRNQEKEIEKCVQRLLTNKNCKNCANCFNCTNCESCEASSFCVNCKNSFNCVKSSWCQDCEYTNDSDRCNECQNCDECYDCKNCEGCIVCHGCTNLEGKTGYTKNLPNK